MKMRGWRRLGVVLSVLWFFGFGWWLRQAELDNAMKPLDKCNAAADRMSAEAAIACFHRADEMFKELYPPLWGTVAVDVLSIALMWLLAWIIIRVGRWVAVGFRT